METRKQELIAEAERNIAAAVSEGGLSPAHERMIDAMQAIVEVLKTEPEEIFEDILASMDRRSRRRFIYVPPYRRRDE